MYMITMYSASADLQQTVNRTLLFTRSFVRVKLVL